MLFLLRYDHTPSDSWIGDRESYHTSWSSFISMTEKNKKINEDYKGTMRNKKKYLVIKIPK